MINSYFLKIIFYWEIIQRPLFFKVAGQCPYKLSLAVLKIVIGNMIRLQKNIYLTCNLWPADCFFLSHPFTTSSTEPAASLDSHKGMYALGNKRKIKREKESRKPVLYQFPWWGGDCRALFYPTPLNTSVIHQTSLMSLMFPVYFLINFKLMHST